MRPVIWAVAVASALLAARIGARTWAQVSEGSASAAVTKRIIETAVEYHCRHGRYPVSFDEMSLDLQDTDGGAAHTLRWIDYRTDGADWFSVQDRLMGSGREIEYHFDPSLCAAAQRKGASAAP